MSTITKVIADTRTRPDVTTPRYFVVEYDSNYPQDQEIVGERDGYDTDDEAQAAMAAHKERWG